MIGKHSMSNVHGKEPPEDSASVELLTLEGLGYATATFLPIRMSHTTHQGRAILTSM